MKKLKVLVACEFSGVVRDAFRRKGHFAWSCDLLPGEGEFKQHHYQGDVLALLRKHKFDMMIAHPECTYLTNSANRWIKDQAPLKSGKLVGAVRREARKKAVDFVKLLWSMPIEKIAIENPVGYLSGKDENNEPIFLKQSQIIEPYQFGHPETKKTCLWLKNLPLLKPSNIVKPEYIIGKKDGKKYSPVHFASWGRKDRSKERSRTYQGWGSAMAEQWGSL